MNKENTEKLFKDFPRLYRDHDKPPSKTRMCDGFACGDGWFELIYELSKEIVEICPKVKAFQVKEKFGTLCFYVGDVQKDKQKKIYEIISGFEYESGKICETCGTKEEVSLKSKRPGSFAIATLCNKCRIEREKERYEWATKKS